MADCVFCAILDGSLPASFVHRDAEVSAFLDIRPVNPGHVLVVPNAHAQGLGDLPEAIGGWIMGVGQRLAAALRRSEVRCEGVMLHLADGEVAGQEVFHVHLHVIPRFRGDGFGLRFGPRYGEQPPRDELDRLALELRSALV